MTEAQTPMYFVCETIQNSALSPEFSGYVCSAMASDLEQRLGKPIVLVEAIKLREAAASLSDNRWALLRLTIVTSYSAQAQLFFGTAKDLADGDGQSGPVVNQSISDARLNKGAARALVSGLMQNLPE